LSPTATTQLQTVRVTDYYIAFNAPNATREPTEKEYNEMNRRITAYFAKVLMNIYEDDPKIEFISMNSSIDFTRYGAEAGIFLNGYNIIMSYSFSDVTFRTLTESSVVVPSAPQISSRWRYSTNYNYFISLVPRTYTGTPFESTDRVYFGETF
jgi:hypothetical protein